MIAMIFLCVGAPPLHAGEAASEEEEREGRRGKGSGREMEGCREGEEGE